MSKALFSVSVCVVNFLIYFRLDEEISWPLRWFFGMATRQALIEDEVLMIENGGEMPEVTFHSCRLFLTVDPDGPQLTLTPEETKRLRLAVLEGYRQIIIRDLTLDNRDKGCYRGLARAIVNVQRAERFCAKQDIDLTTLTAEVCLCLGNFLAGEYLDVVNQKRCPCLNCSEEELLTFFTRLGFDNSRLPAGWSKYLFAKDQP